MAKPKRERGTRVRVFNLLQYEINPATGECLHFDETNIINGVNHETIKKWAYIRHDKDLYTELDIERMREKYGIEIQVGTPKLPHWHIVLYTPNTAPVSVIARWFGIPENMVELPQDTAFNKETMPKRGYGSFIDCVEYLRHSDIKQKEAGKYQYEASEVKANFDWETEVNAYVYRKTAHGDKPLSTITDSLSSSGMTGGRLTCSWNLTGVGMYSMCLIHTRRVTLRT